MANATDLKPASPEPAPDYARYDRIWQRVAPTLSPYPEIRQDMQDMTDDLSLPGARRDPCCMGSAAQPSKEVIEGFYEEECADAAAYQRLAACAPDRAAVQCCNALARAARSRAAELAAIYYLITGIRHRPTQPQLCALCGSWPELLRRRYHAESCDAINYRRAADATADPCLTRLLTRYSEACYTHAEQLLQLLCRY